MELSTLISSMLRLGVPLLLAALGVLVSSKSGIINLGMDGNMLLAAFASAYGAYLSGSPALGLLAAVVGGSFIRCCMDSLSFKDEATRWFVDWG